MGENSNIEWTDHTFNGWVGCTKVSPACDNCYAEEWAKRFGSPELWNGQVRRTTQSNWAKPHQWNRKAEAAGVRHRVFCSSLSDVFDNRADPDWRRDLWLLINATPHLDWLLLTKRPQNIAKMLPSGPDMPAWGRDGWANVWLGTTVENQVEADRRIPALLSVPARVRFLSCEPLLGPVWLHFVHDAETGECIKGGFPLYAKAPTNRLHWVIAGGESGPGARPMHPDWARSLRDQCAAAGVPFFMKQWGEWGPLEDQARRAVPHALADDGTLYLMADIAYPDGSRRGDAIRAGHDKARLTATYRVGKAAAGRLLDGVQHDGVPA